jgi:hypothetical protein
VSIEYDLELAGPLDGVLPEVGSHRGLWWRTGSTDTRAVDLVQARFGFVPTAWVHFRLGPEGLPAQHDAMATLVARVLTSSSGDAVLHADLEEIWLLRRRGRLVLSDDADRWPLRRAAALPPSARDSLDPHPL